MFNFVNNQQQLDEIVFRGRHKAYGAYILRANYHKTVLRALMIMVLAVSALTATAWLLAAHGQYAEVAPEQLVPPIYTMRVELDPPADPAPDKKPADLQKPVPNAGAAAQSFTVGSTDTFIADTLEEETGTETNAIAGTTTTGAGSPTAAGGTGKPGGLSPDTILYDYQVDAAPEFEGGLKALRRFIGENTRYPREQADAGVSGLVMVSFVVDENGSISNATIKQSAGPDFDKEALRVVRLLPKFKKPGMAGGQPVKVYFEQPIRFTAR